MTKKIDAKVVGRILALYHFIPTSRKISNHLATEGIVVSHQTVNGIIKSEGRKDKRKTIKKKSAKSWNVQLIRKKRFVNKVAKALDDDNPPRQKDFASKYKVSQSTISRVVKQDLDWKWRKKTKIHTLTAAQARQRFDRCRRFRRWLSRRKLPFIITIDEMWLSANDTTGSRDGYYQKKTEDTRESRKKKTQSGWPAKVMCAMGVSMRGQTGLYTVPSNVKINGQVFIDHVLKPLFKKDVPRLYPGEERKVILHMDAATAHFSKVVVEWLNKNHITYIPKQDWLANSPDVSPMDYGMNGMFKARCARKKASTASELVKVAKAEWKKIELVKIQNTLRA